LFVLCHGLRKKKLKRKEGGERSLTFQVAPKSKRGGEREGGGAHLLADSTGRKIGEKEEKKKRRGEPPFTRTSDTREGTRRKEGGTLRTFSFSPTKGN